MRMVGHTRFEVCFCIAFLLASQPVYSLDNNDAFTTNSDKLWTIDISVGGQSLIGTAGNSKHLAGLSFNPATGALYVVEEDAIRVLSTVDASVQSSGDHGVFRLDTPAGLAFSPDANLFLMHDETLYSVNVGTGAATAIGPTGLDKGAALAFHPNGQLYAVGEHADLDGVAGLMILDPTTGGTVQVIGALNDLSDPGPFNQGSTGIDFDSKGRLFLAYSGRSKLYRLSLQDATATPVGSLPLTSGSLAIFRDCNENGTHDSHDIIMGSSFDLDGNGIPDACSFCNDGECDSLEDSCNCPEDCGMPEIHEVIGSMCADGIDNDCDLDVDCGDDDCQLDPVCIVSTPGGPGDLLITSNAGRLERIDGVTGQALHSFKVGPELVGPTGLNIGPDGQLYVAGMESRNVVRYHLVGGIIIDTFVQFEAGGLVCAVRTRIWPRRSPVRRRLDAEPGLTI